MSIPDEHPLNNFDNTPLQTCGEGLNKNDKYINTSITDIGIKEKVKKEKSKSKKGALPKEDFDPMPQFVAWIGQTFPSQEPAAKNALYLAITRFVQNRVALKKPYKTAGAVTGICNKLVKYAKTDIGQMIELLDNATEHNWQTVYPLNSAPPSAPKSGGREYQCM